MLLFGDLLQSQLIEPSAIASAEAFGTPEVNLEVEATGIVSAEAFGTSQVNQSLSLTGIASAAAFGNATLTRVYNFTGSGGVVVGGEAAIRRSYVGGGTVTLGGSAPVQVYLEFTQDILWQTRTILDVSQSLLWNTGRVPLRWYRVQGCCQFPTAAGDGIGEGQPGGCDVLPFQSNDEKCLGALGKNQFIQNILASSTNDVCKILKDLNFKWPICDMQRFSRPAESQFIDPSDECNILEPVEFCNAPECMDFCLSSDTTTKIGVKVEVIDSIHTVSPSTGGITLGGSAAARIVTPHYEGSGEIAISGEAEYKSSYRSYEAVADDPILLGGTAPITASNWSYEGSGGITLGGEIETVSPDRGWVGTGGIVLGGEAESHPKITYTGSGTVYISGLAIWGNYYVIGSGGITLGGTAPVTTPSVSYIGGGTVTLAGEAPVVSPDWHFTGSGGVVMGGEAEASVASAEWSYTGSGSIVMDGDAEYRSSEDGNFWYIGSGSITLGGTASDWRYIGSGSITLGGTASLGGTWLGEYTASAGATAFIESLEVNYFEGSDFEETLGGLSATVATKCSRCTSIPVVLDMSHNLGDAAIFKEFLLRNGYVLPDILKMRYNRRNDAWQSNIHFRGSSNNASGQNESWSILAEWACTDELASQELGNFIWKFSIYVKRKNLTTGMDFDTRVLLAFPAKEICDEAARVGLDFSFAFDTATRYVTAENNIVVDVRLLYDNIGLFRSDLWLANPELLINIAEGGGAPDVLRQDIKPIFPKEEELVVLSDESTAVLAGSTIFPT